MSREKLYYYFYDFNNIYLEKNKIFILEFEKEKDRWEVEVIELPNGKNTIWGEITLRITSKLCDASNQNILSWINPAPNAFRGRFKNIKLTAKNPFDQSVISEIFIESAQILSLENPIHVFNDLLRVKLFIGAKIISFL